MQLYTARDVLLSLDWGKKYIWAAYRNASINMVMPIGYILNDDMLYYNLRELLHKYKVTTIVIGYPQQHEDLQRLIDSFLEHLVALEPKLRVIKADEEYTSVQAGATSGDFTKHAAEDTLAAMHILEHFLATHPLSDK